ncbi:TY5A, partial [Symbiodinium microadriaticum]
ENLWPALAALRSRAARRGEGKAQLVLEVMQEIEDSCPDPPALQGVTSDWIRLQGSLDPSSTDAIADPTLVESSCATAGCFLLLLRGAAASKRSLLSAEPLLAERLVRFLLFEFHDTQWGSLTLYHAGHFLLSLGYVCFLVALSDLFLFSGGLWDDAYALNAHVYVLCGQLEDEELGLLLQVYGLETSRSRHVLRDFRSLYGYG